MRLIDADTLKARAIRCSTLRLGSTPTYFKAVGTKEIDKAPTIDAEPVRHGRWDKGHEMMTCTNCCEQFDLYFKNDFNYCPNCGAKMDEVSE